MELKKLHRLLKRISSQTLTKKAADTCDTETIAEIINRIQPIKFILLFDILFEIECFNF